MDAIFDYYKKQMLQVKNLYPHCKIILCTAPITALQRGLKAVVKKVLSRPLGHELENIKRHQFNEKLRAELSDDFSVFDLAEVESKLPDGSIQSFTHKGTSYPSLPAAYTRDGGHLNPLGAKYVAKNLLSFLAE